MSDSDPDYTEDVEQYASSDEEQEQGQDDDDDDQCQSFGEEEVDICSRSADSASEGSLCDFVVDDDDDVDVDEGDVDDGDGDDDDDVDDDDDDEGEVQHLEDEDEDTSDNPSFCSISTKHIVEGKRRRTLTKTYLPQDYHYLMYADVELEHVADTEEELATLRQLRIQGREAFRRQSDVRGRRRRRRPLTPPPRPSAPPPLLADARDNDDDKQDDDENDDHQTTSDDKTDTLLAQQPLHTVVEPLPKTAWIAVPEPLAEMHIGQQEGDDVAMQWQHSGGGEL